MNSSTRLSLNLNHLPEEASIISPSGMADVDIVWMLQVGMSSIQGERGGEGRGREREEEEERERIRETRHTVFP